MSETNLDLAVLYDLRSRLRADRRKESRYTIALPVQVTGFDVHKNKWAESTETINVSADGLSLRLSKKVMIGDVLRVELPLPERLRKPPQSTPTFKTYAAVRYIEAHASQHIVRLQFVRKSVRIVEMQ